HFLFRLQFVVDGEVLIPGACPAAAPGVHPVAVPGARPYTRPVAATGVCLVPTPGARPAGEAPARLSARRSQLAGRGSSRRDGAEEEGSSGLVPVLAQISSSRVHPFCFLMQGLVVVWLIRAARIRGRGRGKSRRRNRGSKEEEKRNRAAASTSGGNTQRACAADDDDMDPTVCFITLCSTIRAAYYHYKL
ncbi:unnamed protein product, partial [Urochloa humidicola]